jgi:hypothetical protein
MRVLTSRQYGLRVAIVAAIMTSAGAAGLFHAAAAQELPIRTETAALATSDVAPGQVQVSSQRKAASADVLRALLSDPAVKSFVGITENAWDFSAPESIPGFGTLP